MSVEAGISTGIASAGASSGGFSSEIGSTPSFSVGTLENFFTPSFSTPSSEAGGGSFTPNLTMESLFSDTTPFIASEGRSFDRPIGNPDAIFSQKSDFSTIAENVKNPKEDTMSNLFKNTMPFVPALESFSERVSLHDAREILGDSINKPSEDLQEGEWASVAKTKNMDLFEDFKSFEPKPVILDRTIDIDLSLGVVATNQAPEQELIDVNQPQKAPLEIKEEDMVQAKRVADALISLGTDKDEAEKQVLEIVREMNRADEGAGQIVSEKVEPKVLPKQSAAVTNAAKAENGQEEEDEEEKKKKEKQTLRKKKEKQKPLVLEVDNSAQSSRKSVFGARLSEAFKTAREKGLGVVRGKDVVQGLTEKREDKSQLLIQAGLSNVPDGSFHEEADEIGNLEIRDTSLMGEIYARIMVNLIVDGKPGVRASDTSSTEPVTEEDEKRVKKFINSSTVPSH